MPRLTDLVHNVYTDDENETVEDIFADAPTLIFTDETHNFHGDPRAKIVYKSRRFGDIFLQVTNPDERQVQLLYSHFLWNAAIKLAELISDGDSTDGGRWSVKGQSVLEFGAGIGLDSIIATLAGAEQVVASDYPAPIVLENIRRNSSAAIPAHLSSHWQVQGHMWGDFDTPFAQTYRQHFSRILAADCFWMVEQHANLVQSMLHFLSLDPGARIFMITGFHSGRAQTAAFFDVAVKHGLVIDEIYEEDANGTRREWRKERTDERGHTSERSKWLVIAQLRR